MMESHVITFLCHVNQFITKAYDSLYKSVHPLTLTANELPRAPFLLQMTEARKATSSHAKRAIVR